MPLPLPHRVYTNIVCERVHPQHGRQVLLGMKKRGFGQHWWNGMGGKVEPSDASIEDAAKRELFEEANITALSLVKRGMLVQDFLNIPTMLQTLEIHVFTCSEYEGEAMETEEMRPVWTNIAEIPYHQMWPDDRYWYKHLLAGEYFIAQYLFDGLHTLVRERIDVVDAAAVSGWTAADKWAIESLPFHQHD